MVPIAFSEMTIKIKLPQVGTAHSIEQMQKVLHGRLYKAHTISVSITMFKRPYPGALSYNDIRYGKIEKENI